jgi:hypothetical protein
LLFSYESAGQAAPGKNPAPPASKSAAPPSPVLVPLRPYTNLQAELDRVRNRPVERDPAKRPLLVSRMAATRDEWARLALERGYLESGHTNAAWDAKAEAAFAAYAALTRATNPPPYEEMTKAIRAARAAGCDDPMLKYMEVRYDLVQLPDDPKAYAFESLRAHEALMSSRHHPVFKFLVGYRAITAASAAEPGCNLSVRSGQPTWDLEDAARDTNAPPAEVFEVAALWVRQSTQKNWLDYILRNLQPILERNFGRTPEWFHWRGLVEIARAWGERGGGFASSVKESGWAGFAEHLAQAEHFLTNAWQLNPNNPQTALLMMRVELGQARGRPRMEQWFRRAMALDTNYFDAAAFMAFYLEPRYYGSDEEALKFARTCVTSPAWGGRVPLVLQNTHHSLAAYYKVAEAPSYWQRPEVWRDVSASYEKFFKLNPDAADWRPSYARDAFLCGHYKEFLAQTKLFTSTNYAFFGGEAKFREMLQKANSP